MRRRLEEATATSKQDRIAARQLTKERQAAQQLAKARQDEQHRQLTKARQDDQRRYDALLRQLANVQERRVNQATRLAAFEQELRDRQTEVGSLGSRLSAAGDELEQARDVLLGIEVKLDILEGAANVLDRRLRVLHPSAGHADPVPALDPADSQ